MGGINTGRVIIGGLLAGLVIDIGEAIANLVLFADSMEEFIAARNLPELGNAAIIGFNVLGFAIGITMVWIYAAIRPRLGPGPKTAACAGLIVWALFGLFPAIGNMLIGMVTFAMMLPFLIFALILYPIAGVVGGWPYQEE